MGDMRSCVLSLSLQATLTSSITLATGAPTGRILINYDDATLNPIFDASRYSSISEWFTASGIIIEMANNATRECLSQFTIMDDNSVCFGNDRWEMDAPALICIIGYLAVMLATAFMFYDWALTSIFWILDVEEEEGISFLDKERLFFGKQDEHQLWLKEEEDRRVDSPAAFDDERAKLGNLEEPHSQDIGDDGKAKLGDAEKRVDPMYLKPADNELLAIPVVADGVEVRSDLSG